LSSLENEPLGSESESISNAVTEVYQSKSWSKWIYGIVAAVAISGLVLGLAACSASEVESITAVGDDGETSAPETSAPEPESTADQITASKCSLTSESDGLEAGWRPDLTLSHVRSPDRLSSTGIINVVVLFADFPDVSASGSTEDVFSIISPAVEFMDDQSNGRLTLSFAPHHKWLRMGADSGSYGEAITTFYGHQSWIQEAIDLADAEVDFSGADAVLVVATPDAKKIPYGPTLTGAAPMFVLKADGNTMTNAVTSGGDLTDHGELWYPHEFGHSLGLPDLYYASIPGRGGFTNPYSLMDDISRTAPGYMGYSRWILDWLDDSQVECITANTTVALTPLAARAGPKLAVVRLSESSALVVEVRRAIGYDSALQTEGVIVSLVETNNVPDYSYAASYGEGPMEVLNDARPLLPGDSMTHQGVTFEVLSSNEDQDLIQIRFED
jgi:M6 family metalloprotease-like protein